MSLIKDGKVYRTLEEQVAWLTNFKDEVYTKSETNILVNEKNELLKEEINSNVYNKNEVYTKQETNSLVDEKDLLVKNEIKETTYTKNEVNELINQAIATIGGKTLLYEGELDLSVSALYPSINLEGYDTYFFEGKLKKSDSSLPDAIAKGYGYIISEFVDEPSNTIGRYGTSILLSMDFDSSFETMQLALRFATVFDTSTSTSAGLQFLDENGIPYIKILDGEVVGHGFKNLIITKIYGVK